MQDLSLPLSLDSGTPGSSARAIAACPLAELSVSISAGSPYPPGGQVLPVHEAGPAGAQLHQCQAGEGEALGVLRAQRQVRLRADLGGGVLSECPGPSPASPAGSGPPLLMLLSLGFMVTPLLCPAVHAGRVGEVAPSPQHTDAGRKQEAVWLCLSSGPQVGPAWPSCHPGGTGLL